MTEYRFRSDVDEVPFWGGEATDKIKMGSDVYLVIEILFGSIYT